METVNEVQTKPRKLLHGDGSEKESQLKQDILALETIMRWWPVQTMGRSGQYSKYVNEPNSRSGSAPAATASRLLCELPKPTLDVLAMKRYPENLGIVQELKISGVDEGICVSPCTRMREKGTVKPEK